MLKLFIADDELYIREGLQYIINWESLDIEICGIASDGEEAISGIMQNKPDIILIDIRMPKYSGLEVISKCQEKEIPCYFILLTGYSDFEYAKQAIKLGVKAYLTKPIAPEELISSVTSLRDIILEKKSSVFRDMHYKKKAALQLIQELITGICPPENFPIQSLELKSLQLDADIYQIVIIENFYNQRKGVNFSFSELLCALDNNPELFESFNIDQLNIILLKGKKALSRFQHFLEHYENKPLQTNSPLDNLFMTYGHPVSKLAEIRQSYDEAVFLLNRRFFCIQNQHILGFLELPNVSISNNKLTSTQMNSFCNKLTDNIMTFNRPLLAETLYNLENYLYNVENDIPSIKLFITDIYFQTMERIKISYSTLVIPYPAHSDTLNEINNTHFLFEIILYLSKQFETILQYVGSPDHDSILEDIQYYIKHNYRTNIRLETIAPLFGYNSCYLGRLFHQTVGESFNNYLDRIRIEKAKDHLLDDTLKVYQIAEMVGYNNVEYFYRKFKKVVGDTPSDFRRKILYV
jgi:two-component system response regulator YesN